VRTAYEPGMTMTVRGEEWALLRAQPFESCTVLTLEGRERSNTRRRLRVIEPFDRPRAPAARRLHRRRRHAVMRAALAAIASARGDDRLWTAAGAAIDLWPYQLEPALAAIGGATRLLLADAVGLGKTIQAGLLLAELRERGWVERTLILCPAGLRDAWAGELRERFRLSANVVDCASMTARIAALPQGVNPWTGSAITIASIDFVKRPEVLAAIDTAPIDLLIADEAHHLAPGTDRGAAVMRLAARAPWCVLLSATPHSGDDAAFRYLTSIGANGDRLMVFNRSRRDAGLAGRRRAHALRVRPSDEERALLAAVDAYARAIWRARGAGDRAARLIAITVARRAASSSAAIERTLVRRRALLAAPAREPVQSLLPWEETDPADDIEPDAVLGAPGLDDPADERARLDALIELAAACGTGSKLRRLLRLLSAIDEPALVFTEYRDTLEAILAGLPSSYRAASIHGGMPMDLRRRAVDDFNAGVVNVLLATDAAGEGLNLHHRCRLVIDLELPWNPVRLEQRVGRLDRIGQRRTVHAIRLYQRDSIESRVLDHLRLRQQRAEAGLERCVTDTQIAGAIFGGETLDAPALPRLRGDRIAAAGAEAERIALQRRALMAPPTPCWARSRHARRLVILHRTRWSNGAGLIVHEQVHAHRVHLPALPHRARDWRRAIETMSAVIREQGIDARSPARRTEPIARRIASIRARLARLRAREYQRSLFDGRADAAAAVRDQAADDMDAALLRTLRAIGSEVATEAPRCELIAAWPEHRR
jgi:superfamily II DNA or RNA helicase